MRHRLAIISAIAVVCFAFHGCGDDKPAEPAKPVEKSEAKPADAKPADAKPADAKPAEAAPAPAKP